MSRTGLRESRRSPRRPRVYLHIGPMKTGTTYLQRVMANNRRALASGGLLFPGARWPLQSRGVREILGTPRGGGRTETWDGLVASMLEHPGEASVVSMEFLSYADPPRAARVVESLAGAEVHVVLTVRDALRTVPAQWQTLCRNGRTVPWPRFVRGLRDALDGTPGGPAAHMLRRTQSVPRMLAAWLPLVGSDRVHVVTVPAPGSEPRLLWERFAGALGIDPALAVKEIGPRNRSLGHASTELLRRVNVVLADVPAREFAPVVRGQVCRPLAERTPLERPVGFNRRGTVTVGRWNEAALAAIDESGVRLVGDRADVPVHQPDQETPRAFPTPAPEEIVAAAGTAREALLELAPDLPERPASGSPARTPERAAVLEVADLVRACVSAGALSPGSPRTP